MANGMVASLEVLDPVSEDYAAMRNVLANSLQNLGQPTSVVIQRINDGETAQRFDKMCRKKMKVSGWSNMSKLGVENDAESLSQGGFTFGPGHSGMEFRVGIITEAFVTGLLDPHLEHTLVYSDLGVGRSYVEDKNLNATDIPEGYDSFYIPPLPLDRDGDGHFDIFEYNEAANFDGRDPSNYEHRYFLKDAAQMRPRYIVKFRFIGASTKRLEYESSKEGSAESKEAKDAEKPYDPLDEYSYFDPVAHKPVTLRDKMTLGSRSRVVLVPVDNAYKQAMSDYATVNNVLVENKKEWLESQLDVIEEKVRQVNVNYADVVEQIEGAARQAIETMEKQTKHKLEVLLSAEVEMRRQKEQIDWMDHVAKKTAVNCQASIDAALEVQKSGKNVAGDGNQVVIEASREINKAQLEFLECWKNITHFRVAAGRFKPTEYLEALREVTANVKVRSNIEVYTAKSSAANKGGMRGQNEVGGAGVNGPLGGILQNIQDSSFYSEAVQPTAGGVHPLLHSAVDMEMDKIRSILANIIKNPDPAPLPKVIYRPPNDHDEYSLPLLVDLVSKDRGMNAARSLADQILEKAEKGGNTDLKRQYYSRMDELLGKPPPFAKDAPMSADMQLKENLELAKQQAAKAQVAKENAMKKQKEKEERKELERKKKEEEEAQAERKRRATELKLQEEYLDKQRAMESQKQQWALQQGASRAHDPLVDASHRQGMSLMASSPTNKGTYLGAHTLGVVKRTEDSRMRFGVMELHSAMMSFLGDLSPYSLEFAARKRKEKMMHSIFEEDCQMMIKKLGRSKILEDDEAEKIYYALPFFSQPPSCELMYSSDLHTTGDTMSMHDLYEKCLLNSSPSILLIRSGDFTFGAYLTHPLRVTSNIQWAGSPACFIFSVSLDVKFTYHGRQQAPETIATTIKSLPASFKCEHDRISIGNGDLIIKDRGLGESNLEKCYGLGFAVESPEAQCMLAGSKMFGIDSIEVWAVTQGST